MYPWTGYADFTPTSCSWAQELYLQQLHVSRSKMRGDLKFIREDNGFRKRWYSRASDWGWRGHGTNISQAERKGEQAIKAFYPLRSPGNSASLEPASSFNALLYSTSLVAAMSNYCIWGGCFCYRSFGQPVTGQGSQQEGFASRPEADCIFPFCC